MTLAATFIIAVGILVCAFGIAVWMARAPGHAPDMEEALDAFVARYPDVTVVEMKIARDEAAMRSFAFDYRIQSSGSNGRIDVQYVKGADGKWEMRPEPPAQLQ